MPGGPPAGLGAALTRDDAGGKPSDRSVGAPVQRGILGSFVRSLHTMFLIGVPLAVVMSVGAVLLRQVPLRTSSALDRPDAEATAPSSQANAMVDSVIGATADPG